MGRIQKNPLTFCEESRNCFGVRPDHTGMAQEGRKLGRFGDGTDEVIGALIEVHRHLGPGLMESAYEACLSAELSERRLEFERQRPLPIRYKGVHLDCAYRLDLVASRSYPPGVRGGRVMLLPIHEAQVITYLRLSQLPVGLLVNFNVTALRNGLRRLTPDPPIPSALPPFL